jgi:hypothetical protein
VVSLCELPGLTSLSVHALSSQLRKCLLSMPFWKGVMEPITSFERHELMCMMSRHLEQGIHDPPPLCTEKHLLRVEFCV